MQGDDLTAGETRDRSIGRVLIVSMILGFLALIAAGGAAAWITQRIQTHTRWVNHTYEVEIAIGRARILAEQTEVTRRGYLLTGQPSYLASYRVSSRALPQALARLEALTRDNPVQVVNLATWRTLIADIVAQRRATFALVEAGRRDAALALFAGETSSLRMTAIRDQAQKMLVAERALLATRDAEQQRSVRSFYVVLAIAGLILLFVAVASLLTVMRYTRDLAASRNSLHRLNETLEEQVAERTADLSRANEEIQRFAYIVSHDLRSPLVNVMGFTAELSAATGPLADLVKRAEEVAPEIVTEEARLAAREDLPESIRFIRSSTQKMDRLINAILKLSREGRRTIAPEPLDVAAIADAAVSAIRHVIDDRGVTVTVERPIPEIVSDRFAIEQILSNLIENATKYLQPGRAGQVTVSATAVRGRVIVSVADNGRGIDPRDHQRIFDLFRRSGAQDQPGEGIGLAHVRALAYRLGGTIDVASRLGEGATFRLNLPATFQAPPQD